MSDGILEVVGVKGVFHMAREKKKNSKNIQKTFNRHFTTSQICKMNISRNFNRTSYF